MNSFLQGLIDGFLVFLCTDAIIYFVKPLKKRFWDNSLKIFGLHIHHSFYGLIILAVGLFGFPFLVGFGLGMIIEHTLTDKRRFIFIER